MERQAPIVLFAFNRPDTFSACIRSLRSNSGAAESDLFVFIDGARPIVAGECEKVEEVKRLANGIHGFKSVTVSYSEKNCGLGPSVIRGVTDVICHYGRAIVIEDDLILSPNCLHFLNNALDRYEDRSDVFSVCAYSNRVSVPKGYQYDAYFCPRSSSWGWATWKDRWEKCDWLLEDWAAVKGNACEFNHWGGSDCFKMLRNWKEGRNQSWAIRFCYNQFIQKSVSLFPLVSKVRNEGFDGSGTNCHKWNRFKSDFDLSDSLDCRMPEDTHVDSELRRQCLSYHSLIKRAYSRIMYMIYR